jgi:hypothetical protein
MKNIFFIALLITFSCSAQKTIDKLNDKRMPDEFFDKLAFLNKSDTVMKHFFYQEKSDKFITRYFIDYSVSSFGSINGDYFFQKIKTDGTDQPDSSKIVKEDRFKIQFSKIVLKCKTHNGKHECGLLDKGCQETFEKLFQCSEWYPSN